MELGYLLPFLPDLNPIEDFFAELKGSTERHWSYYEKDTDQGFNVLLQWCIDIVGAREDSARAIFRT